jgi:hypothetical protein
VQRCSGEGFAGERVSRVLDAHGATGERQRHSSKAECHLRSRDDQQLARITVDGSSVAQILCNGFPQRRVSGRIAEPEEIDAGVGVLPNQPSKGLVRESIEGWKADAKDSMSTTHLRTRGCSSAERSRR